MDRIANIKVAAYFFSVVSSASLYAMELELQKPKSCVENTEMRMEMVYKKFGPFFSFDEAILAQHKNTHPSFVRIVRTQLKYRKFPSLKPEHLLSSTEDQDNILSSLIARPGCFIHDETCCFIALTKEERDSYSKLSAEVKDALSTYAKTYID
jgi:hypothetical protein